MQSRTMSVIALTAALMLGATACGADDESEGDDPKASGQSSATGAGGGDEKEASHKKDVTITKSGVEDHEGWGDGAYVVHYKITNGGDVQADYFAGLEFLDADGDVLGTTGITADKLGPGKSSTGDTAPVESEIENGKMTDIRDVRVSQVDRQGASAP